jgi:hypothetical protein
MIYLIGSTILFHIVIIIYLRKASQYKINIRGLNYQINRIKTEELAVLIKPKNVFHLLNTIVVKLFQEEWIKIIEKNDDFYVIKGIKEDDKRLGNFEKIVIDNISNQEEKIYDLYRNQNMIMKLNLEVHEMEINFESQNLIKPEHVIAENKKLVKFINKVNWLPYILILFILLTGIYKVENFWVFLGLMIFIFSISGGVIEYFDKYVIDNRIQTTYGIKYIYDMRKAYLRYTEKIENDDVDFDISKLVACFGTYYLSKNPKFKILSRCLRDYEQVSYEFDKRDKESQKTNAMADILILALKRLKILIWLFINPFKRHK